MYFYPRSPCGERRNGHPDTRQRGAISIHALLAESDFVNPYKLTMIFGFLSTLSLRRATGQHLPGRFPFSHFYPRSPCGERPHGPCWPIFTYTISIHALLAESDRTRPPPRPRQRNFYPRSPCGERRTTTSAAAMPTVFLSTLSLRRATPRPSI